jgi:hypothetical protein
MFKLFSILIALTLLGGCANMNKSMCLNANWQTIGFEDGAAGRPQTDIAQHRKDCAQHGVTPDLDAYRQGHDQGSELFCTTQNGFMYGSSGKAYKNNCPDTLAADFLSGFRDGERLFAITTALDNANKDLNANSEHIKSLQTQIEQKNEMMIADGLIREERLKIRQDIDHLQVLQDELYQQQIKLEQIVSDAQDDFAKASRQFSHYY